MTKKEFSFLFTVCVSVYNILLALVIETVLFLLLIVFMSKNQQLGQSVFVQIALPVTMILGLVASITLSNKTVRWTIKKFSLEEKLSEKIIEHYKKDDSVTLS